MRLKITNTATGESSTAEYPDEVGKNVLIKNRKDRLRKPPATVLVYEKVTKKATSIKATSKKEVKKDE